MKLRPEYESVRSSIMSRVPSPSLDEYLNELREETSQLTQLTLKQRVSGGPLLVAYLSIILLLNLPVQP